MLCFLISVSQIQDQTWPCCGALSVHDSYVARTQCQGLSYGFPPCHWTFTIYAQHSKQTDTGATPSVPSCRHCRGFLHKVGQVGACCYPDKQVITYRSMAAHLPLLQEGTHDHISTLRRSGKQCRTVFVVVFGMIDRLCWFWLASLLPVMYQDCEVKAKLLL